MVTEIYLCFDMVTQTYNQGCSQLKCNHFLNLHFYLHFLTLSTIIIAFIVTFSYIKQYIKHLKLKEKQKVPVDCQENLTFKMVWYYGFSGEYPFPDLKFPLRSDPFSALFQKPANELHSDIETTCYIYSYATIFLIVMTIHY